MKKSILLASIFIFMFSTTFVFAQTEETGTTTRETRTLKRENIKEVMEQKRENLSERVQTKKAEIRTQIEERKSEQRIRLQEKAQERVKMVLSKIFTRFDAVIVRFEGFLDRIESRITKMEEKGLDTTTVTELFETAQTKVNDSATLIIAMEAELNKTVEGESSRETLRASLDQIKESLKTAQSALKDVVVEIKSSEQGSEDRADVEEEE